MYAIIQHRVAYLACPKNFLQQ